MKKPSLYVTPFYTEEEKKIVTDETRKFMLWSNKDYAELKRTCQGYGRKIIQVFSPFNI